MIDFVQELTTSRDYKRKWLVELDAQAAAPNRGFPLKENPSELGIVREALKEAGIYRSSFDAIREYDLLCVWLYGDSSPAEQAANRAKRIRRELVQIEFCLANAIRNRGGA